MVNSTEPAQLEPLLPPDIGRGGVIAAFQRTAQAFPDRGIDLYDRGGVKHFLTYAQLFEGASAVATQLIAEGRRPGDRILVALPSGFDFICVFFGSLMARLQPIPVPPPRADTVMSAYLGLVQRLAGRLQTSNLVTASAADGPLLAMAEVDHAFEWVVPVDKLLRLGEAEKDLKPPDWSGIRPNDIAYIQCSSGSTGSRKAVALSHRNLLTSVADVGSAIDVRPDDVGVSWLPLYHDMGLVGALVFCVAWGIPLVIVHPERFLRAPHEWLVALSNHGGTVTLSPDFGFHYCTRRAKESDLEGLDLSSWRVALCGSEPIQLPHLRKFERRFAPMGLRENTVVPVYGLVESTLGVSFGRLGDGRRILKLDRSELETRGEVVEVGEDDAGVEMLSHGPPMDHVEVRIVDEEGETLPEGRVGEIHVRGPTVMLGYVDDLKTRAMTALENLSDEFVMGTSTTGELVLETEDPATRWIGTGDLGFLYQGELYIAGRAADVVVLGGGRKLYPDELESFVGRIDGVRPGSVAVFGIPVSAASLNRHEAVREAAARVAAQAPGREASAEGSDAAHLLVVAVEAAEGVDREQLAEAISQAVHLRIGCFPHDVRVLSPRSVPKTSSGKIRRFKCRDYYLEDALDRSDREERWRGLVFITERARSYVAQMGRRMRGFFDRDEG
jgi:fatty-acyl-CoA synthase